MPREHIHTIDKLGTFPPENEGSKIFDKNLCINDWMSGWMSERRPTINPTTHTEEARKTPERINQFFENDNMNFRSLPLQPP